MQPTDVRIGETYIVEVANNPVPVKITHEHANGGWVGISQKSGKAIRIKDPARLQPQPANESEERSTDEPVVAVTDPTQKPVSLIKAAAIVLKASDRPLSCKEIVAKAIESNTWTPGYGKTPANTLYAAITREIADKGDSSRFIKVQRGRFIANPHVD